MGKWILEFLDAWFLWNRGERIIENSDDSDVIEAECIIVTDEPLWEECTL